MTNPDHAAQLEKFGIKPFDLVVVNLYPFADTVRSGADEAAVIEKIDIGGPSMVRGAAKNSATVAIVTDPADYALVAARVANGEGFSLEERRWLAGKAFAHTAAYDATINEWTAKHWPKPATVESADPAEGENPVNEAKFPAAFTRTWTARTRCAMARTPTSRPPLPRPARPRRLRARRTARRQADELQQLRGRRRRMARSVGYGTRHRRGRGQAQQPVRPRHRSHRGRGSQEGPRLRSGERLRRVIACNTTVTLEMAESVRPIFTEVIVAPAYEDAALELLKTKKKNLRILKVAEPPKGHTQFRQIDGGLLVQDMDLINATGDDPDAWKLVAGEPADEATLKDLVFAWRAIRCVKSNAILLAHDQPRSHRYGPGQPRGLLPSGRRSRQHAGRRRRSRHRFGRRVRRVLPVRRWRRDADERRCKGHRAARRIHP